MSNPTDKPTTESMEEMSTIWARFLATNPGPDYVPWDQMSEAERETLRAHASAGDWVETPADHLCPMCGASASEPCNRDKDKECAWPFGRRSPDA